MTEQESIQRLMDNINVLRVELGGSPLTPEEMIQTALSRMFIDLYGEPDGTMEDWHKTCQEMGYESGQSRPEDFKKLLKLVEDELQHQGKR